MERKIKRNKSDFLRSKQREAIFFIKKAQETNS